MVAQGAGSKRIVHTSAAERVPKIRKTGNEQADSTKEAERECMMALIDNMIWDSSHILPLYNLLQKRLASSAVEQGDGYFSKLSTIYALPEDWLATLITSQSEFNSTDIVSMKKYDEESLGLLVYYAMQLPKHLKLPECCSLRAFTLELFKPRMVEVGGRLSGLKEAMGFQPSVGRLNFGKRGCYSLEFNEGGCVTKLVHISGAEVAVNPEVHRVTRQYVLVHNHSDKEAALVLQPFPPIRLQDFFKSPLGPHRYSVFKGGKGKDWERHCELQRTVFDESRSGGVDQNEATRCRQQLEEMSAQKKKDALKRARATAQQTLQQRKEKRKISLVQ